MVAYLTGVLQDGTNPAPGVPINPRVPIRCQLGGSLVINLKVVRPSGGAVPLTGGSLVLTVKARPQDVAPAFQIAGALAPTQGPNAATFTLSHTATKALQPGRYVYDVVFTDVAGNRDAVVPLSAFLLEPAATTLK